MGISVINEAYMRNSNHIHAVQYMVCDQSCMIMDGLMPESERRVCTAERKQISCSGELVFADPSLKRFCKDEIEEPALARLNDCRMEENGLGVFSGLV